MKLSILIVNYNTEKFILDFLNDLQNQTINSSTYEVVIVNNTLNNALTETINNSNLKEHITIKIVQSAQNIGFGRAMNLAASNAQGKHLLIANPDLRMMQHDYLEPLLQHAESNPDYGLITTQLINDDQKDKSEFYDFEFHETFGFKNKIAWFSGALLLIRNDVMQQINGFDPDFFMYCEDEDICLRVKKLGLSLIKINELKIYHKGGSSEPYQNYDFFYRWYRSQILFAYKHFSTNQFEQLLEKLNKTSIWKSALYKALSILLPTKRHKFQYDQWSAMKDVTNRTLNESIEWLYFKI